MITLLIIIISLSIITSYFIINKIKIKKQTIKKIYNLSKKESLNWAIYLAIVTSVVYTMISVISMVIVMSTLTNQIVKTPKSILNQKYYMTTNGNLYYQLNDKTISKYSSDVNYNVTYKTTVKKPEIILKSIKMDNYKPTYWNPYHTTSTLKTYVYKITLPKNQLTSNITIIIDQRNIKSYK